MSVPSDAQDWMATAIARQGDARALLAELETTSFLSQAIAELTREPSDGHDWYRRRPWVLLLAMKWALEQPVLPDERRRPATLADLHAVGEHIWDAGLAIRTPDYPLLLLRRLAFQQFWYQRHFDSACLGRQSLLFGEWMHDSDIVRTFVRAYGIEPMALLHQLALIIAGAGIIRNDKRLRALAPTNQREDHEKEFKLAQNMLTTDIDALRAMVARPHDQPETPLEVEICEQSSLIVRPFITLGDDAQLIHHKLLFRAVETALFDRLRALDTHVFMHTFGNVFERYVGDILRELGDEVVPEVELMGLLTGNGRCVDFAVVRDDALLLVDAKGIEGNYDGLYHSEPSTLTEKLRSSALRAVDQGVSTCARLPAELQRPVTYLLCVTYKQLNIGTGELLRELTRGTADWDDQMWTDAHLPPTHMFTISIEELEHVVGYARATGHTFHDVLGEIVTGNKDPNSRQLLVDQYFAGRVTELEWPRLVREAAQRLLGHA